MRLDYQKMAPVPDQTLNPSKMANSPDTSLSQPYPKVHVQIHRTVFEWQTWLLIVVIYSSWGALIYYFNQIPLWISTPLLILVGAWYMSLQHELLHGHPTRYKWFNHLLGIFPIAVWYPYAIYRDAHIQHHVDEDLTKPHIDSESNYLPPNTYANLHPVHQWFRWVLRTTLGRFLLGPAWAIYGLVKTSLQQFHQGNFQYLVTWTFHLSLLGFMLYGLESIFHISAVYYILMIAYLSLGLAMLRSFYEHRPALLPQDRIVINEASWFWRLLYLNNNFHSVHHAYPSLPWYAIDQVYFENKAAWQQVNHGFLLDGYTKFLFQHFIRPVDHPEHNGLGL